MQTYLQDAAVVAILVQNLVAQNHAVQNHVVQHLAHVLNHAAQNHAVLSLAAQNHVVLNLAHVLVQNLAAKLVANQFADVEIAADQLVDVTVIQITVTAMATTLTKMVVKAITTKTVHLSTEMVVTGKMGVT